MHEFTPLSALLGGSIIGLSASLFLLTHGKVAGISGLYAGALTRGTSDRVMRIAFIAGLVTIGTVLRLVAGPLFVSAWQPTLPIAVAAGLLVGVGTRLGSGCTSGHGVCGVSRLSVRSLLATATFMATGFATVYVVRHVLGAGR